jgi:tripartite-type tricarboxylate transporter receptor subunit TctC
MIHSSVSDARATRSTRCPHGASALAAAALLACATFADAQTYPAKTVRLVIPLAPGGGGDIVSRAIAAKLTEQLGQSVIVDNRPGGATIIGTEHVARSPPDGYTLVMATSSHVINPSLYKLPFDPVKDFAAISLIATTPMMLAVHPNVPARTVRELIGVAKIRPGQLNYGSSGPASIVHLLAEMFDMMGGVKTTHIPYKGTGPALTDLIGGQIDMMFASPVPTLPHVRNGRLRALALTSAKRSTALPDLPTVAESGLPGFEGGSWYGLLAPAGTPGPVLGRLHAETAKAARHPDVVNRLASDGAEIVAGTGEQATLYMQTEIARWIKVVRAANIKVQ